MSQQAIREALEAYRASLPPDSPRRTAPWVAEGFGDGPELADRLGALVLAGVKTATCSAWWEWQASGDPLPRAGLLTVVLDGQGRPLAITETTEVRILAFNQVDEAVRPRGGRRGPHPGLVAAGALELLPAHPAAHRALPRGGHAAGLRALPPGAPSLGVLATRGRLRRRGALRRPAWKGRAP